MKSFAAFFLPPALLVLLVTLGVGLALNRAELDKLQVYESSFLTSGTDAVLSILTTPVQHLRGLVREPAINQAFQAPPAEARTLMGRHLLTLVYRNPLYDQVRWLSATGMELARVNATPADPVIVPERDLQDKSARCYYREAIRLAPGAIYLSPLDLNIEHEVVEVPYKPMIRMAIRLPVVEGQDQGLLVINYLAQSLLDNLRRLIPPGHEPHPMLLNPAGYWLLAPDPQDAWGFMFGRDATLGQRHPQEWARISAQPDGQILTSSGLWSWTTIDPARLPAASVQSAEVWKLVTHVSAAELWRVRWHLGWPLLLIAASSLVLLAVGIRFYRRLLAQQERSESALALVRVQQAAAEDQRRAEQRWKLALDGAGHGVWDWRLATDTVDFSPGWKTMLGYADDEIGNGLDEWSSRVHPDELPRVLAAVQSHLAGATTHYESVHRMRHKDGHWFWVLDRGRVLERDADGQPARMVGTHTDISAQKDIEASLSQTQRTLEEAQRIAHLGSFEYDALTRETRWSDEEYRIYGLEPAGSSPVYDEMLARCIHPADADLLHRTFSAALAHQAIYELEHRIVRPDGSVRWVADRAYPICDAQGRLLRYSGVTLDITERKGAEEALKQNEEHLRLATDGAELGIWYWDLATQTLDWSERCKVHLGLPPGVEPSFDHFYQAMHPDDRSRVEALINQAVADRSEYNAEYRVRWTDGCEHWISALGRVYTHPDGTLRGMGGTTQDITARKQAEQNLRDSERRFREMFEHLPIAYQSLDSDGRWLDANQKLADLLGFDRPEDLLGLNFVDYWDDRLRDQFASNYPRFKENLSIDGEVRLHRRDGQAVTVLFAGRIQRDDQGNFLRTHCILTDISEQRALEDEIRALNASLEQKVAARTTELEAAQAQIQETLRRVSWSEARFRTMFAEAPLGIALIDSQTGRIYELNDRFAAIAGRTREEMMTSDWMHITHPDDMQADLDQMARLNAGEIPGFQINKRFLKPDGRVVWISMTIAPVTLKPGESPRHLCMIDDITARVRLESALQVAKEAAEAATAAKSEFLAHMSHEIRTPMNAVLGLAQLLGRERLSNHQAVMVARIQSAGQTLLGIINDILDLSKIEAGQLRLESRPFDLATLLQRLDSLLAPAAGAKGLALRLSPAPAALGPLQGDALRLEQVLINLLGNAIKFTASGEVSLTVTALDPTPADALANPAPAAAASPSQRLRFAVRDTGIGMSPAALASLFQPFTQADAGITRRFGGTGLGLSISQRLVALMGGEIQVESTEGQGSTFSFELTFAPAAALEPAAPAVTASEPPTGPRLSGLHLLVVDDSALNRDLVERLLTLEGARVTLAADGQQAVQLLQTPTSAYNAVLMDVQMPVMDGRTATRLIRGDLGLKDLPVIALTAGVMAQEQRAIRDAGANEVLAKPLDLEQLVATLLRLIPAPARQATAQATEQGAGPADAAAVSTAGQLGSAPFSTTGPRGTSPTATTAARPGIPGDFPLIAGIDRDRAALATGHDRAFFLRQLARLLRDAATTAADTRRDLRGGDRESAARRMHSLKGNAGNLGALDLMQTAAALEQAILDRTAGLETAIQEQMTNLATATQEPMPGLVTANQVLATDLDAGLTDLDRQLQDLAAASAPWLVGRDAQGQAGGEAAVISAGVALGVPAGGQSDVQAQAQARAEAQAQAEAQAEVWQAAVPAGAAGEGAAPVPAPLELAPLAALRDALQRHDLAAQDHYEELAPALTAAWGEAETQALGEAIADLKFGAALAQLDRQVTATAVGGAGAGGAPA